jgi:uncharacterized membrane protein YgcG
MNDSRDINTTTTAKNVKKIIPIVSAAVIVAIVLASTSSSISLITMAVAQQTGNTTTTPTTPTLTITLTDNAVQVNATEINGYKWQINGHFNPDLRMLANTAYTFTVQNPTDSTHELRIADSQGKDLATSGDIQPGGGSGILNFKTNMTSSGGGNMLGYYCEYHPDLMKGSIQIVNQ